MLNGMYLCHTQLGRQDAAEAACGRIVSLGLATNNLSVKFLFKPGATELISDQKINASYTMWLRQIAKETAAAKVPRKNAVQTGSRSTPYAARSCKQSLSPSAHGER